MTNKIGIIGGSYNPVHLAHLIIAEHFFEQIQLNELYFVPAHTSPFKFSDENSEDSLSEHRLEMLRLALHREPNFKIETYELEKAGISYTIDTVRFMKNKFPNAELFLLVGGDQAAAFTKWKQWDEIAKNVQLCIVRRPHTIAPEIERSLEYMLTVGSKKPLWIDAPALEISSSAIRERIRRNRSIRFLVTREVESYIQTNKLYT